MSEFSIRAATASDSPIVVMLLRELADYEKLQPVFHLTEALVRRDMLGAACHTELAFSGDAPAGIASWYWTYKSFRAARGLFVEDLYVRPDFRSRGLGRRMLARLAGEALAVGAFMEWQVLDWNESGIAFYKSLGAAQQPHWLNYRLQGEALQRIAS